ncbi:putative ubiquitin-conjugating enzyme E2 23 [Orobanche hederae]
MVSGDESGDRRPVKRMKTNDGGDGGQQQTDLVTSLLCCIWSKPLVMFFRARIPASLWNKLLVMFFRSRKESNNKRIWLQRFSKPQEQAVGDAGPEIFAGDIVKNKRTNEIGVVSADLRHFLPVARNTEEDLTVQEVIVVGRDFKHGKAVSSATERTKIGKVSGVRKWVDLADSTGTVAHRDIEAVKLERTQCFYYGDGMPLVSDRSVYVGDFVIRNAWIGRVEDIQLRVTVKLENFELVSKVPPDVEHDFIPLYANRMEEAIARPYYTGQAIDCSLGEHLGTMRGNVVEQEVQYVTVNWLTTYQPAVDGNQPPPEVNMPTDLELPNFFVSDQAEWEIGERCSFEGQVYLVVNLRTTITVKWQDGTSSEVDGLDVVPLENAEGLFFCGQFVSKKVERGSDDCGYVVKVTGDKAQVMFFPFEYPETVKIEKLELESNFDAGQVVVWLGEPYYGVVLDHCDGKSKVAWADGTVTMANTAQLRSVSPDIDMDEDDIDGNSGDGILDRDGTDDASDGNDDAPDGGADDE